MSSGPAEMAATALVDLNMFAAIAALCENSLISVEHQPAEFKIIEICRAEQKKALRRYDRHLAQVKS